MKAALLVLLLGGCESTQSPKSYEPLPPAPVSRTTSAISFRGLINPLPAETPIGTFQAGLACGGQYHLTFIQTGELSRVYADRFYEELRKAGYRVVGDKSQTTAIQAVTAKEPEPDLTIARTIRHIVWNVCQRYLTTLLNPNAAWWAGVSSGSACR
jgi:hypothetical protein